MRRPSTELQTKRPKASLLVEGSDRNAFTNWLVITTVEGDIVALPHNTKPFNIRDLLSSKK